jgi:outer membrane protein TolC
MIHLPSIRCFRGISLVPVALVAALCGCASSSQSSVSPTTAAGPSPRSPDEVRFAGAADRAVRAPVLEREAFVRAVLERNPWLEAARQSFRAALARVRRAGVFEDPMVEVGIAPLSFAPSSAPLGWEVGVSQKLPWWGKRALETEASEAEASAVRNDYEAMKRELGLAAVTLYDEYFVAVRSLEINAQHVALIRLLHESAVAALASGRGSPGDALMAEAELTHLEHAALSLTAQRDVTAAQMNELLHRAPDLPLPPPPKDLPLPGVPDAAPGSGVAALSRRPDIAATEQRARAEGARAERAERDSYPDITLSTAFNSMWDDPAHRFTVGVGFNLPLQAGARAGAADEARAERARMLSEAARLTDAARTELFVAQRQLVESKHVVALFEQRLLPVARDAIDAARAGFISSRNPFNAVIDAERNLRGIELDYQTKRAELVRRRAELDHALGRIPGLDWKGAAP